ncbi:MAG: hypothetical protein M3015_07540 [Bacteroidota bacterium]|nr:hypothetical protein [Bacteroidota bacterium]
MAINLVEAVQQKLNAGELQKIDPNTNAAVHKDEADYGNRIYQVAIPAVLTGLYKFTRIDENNQAFINNNNENLSSFFGENTNDVINKISEVTASNVTDTKAKMQQIAEASLNVLRVNLPENFKDVDVKNFLTAQRHNILLYLDPALNLGSYISDDTIDDSTNKMEGPVTNIMHTIGQIFSGSGNDQKEEI